MKKCIMIGNGINRCLTTNISWSDLLKKIADDNAVELNNNISFPMQFENLANQILRKSCSPSDNIYDEMKKTIIDQIKSAKPSLRSLHKTLSEKADSVITTNYDFLIESSLDPLFYVEEIPNNKIFIRNKYNINNYVVVNNKPIFHIHGDLRSEYSICLGYEHYAGTLQNLRNVIVTKKEKNGVKKPAIIWYLENKNNELNTWGTKFFTDEVHIVGFGLTQSEIDIWWLITYRSSLICANRFNGRDLIRNKIVFHDISTHIDTDMKYALENNEVIYQFHKINDCNNFEYECAYRKIAESIFNV